MMKLCVLISLVLLFMRSLSAGPKVEFLSGVGEIRRAGSPRWEFVSQGAVLNDNDRVRTLSNGTLSISWPNSDTCFVQQNTALLINAPKSGSGFITTLLSGKAFFVSQELLDFTGKRSRMQIHTNVAVVSMNGSSLINSRNDTTAVTLVTGTAQVHHLQKSHTHTLYAPVKLMLSPEDKGTISTFLTDDLDSVRTIVPDATLERVKREHLTRARRDHLVLSGKLEDKSLVCLFADNSSYAGHWDIPSVITTHIKSQLTQDIEHLIFAFHPEPISCTDKLAEIAKEKTARYIINGSIENFDLVPYAEISASADSYREYVVARVRIDVQVYDATIETTVLDEQYSGEISSPDREGLSWQELEDVALDFDNPRFSSTLIAQALRESLAAIAQRLPHVMR